MQPDISVIIPTFNRADIICDALDSIQREKLASSLKLEILISDDFSNDSTRAVVESWKQENNFEGLHYHCLAEKGGVCKARNQGVEHAKGELLVFLDSDDQLLSGALTQIKHIFDSNEQVSIYYGAIQTKSGRMGFLPDQTLRSCLLDFKKFILTKGEGEYLHACRASLLNASDMRFPENLNGFESFLWMKALQDGALLWIDPTPVRLYDDLRDDRLCHPLNLAQAAERLARGFSYFFSTYGRVLRQEQRDYWEKLLFRVIFYSKANDAWSNTLRSELSDDIAQASWKVKLCSRVPDVLIHKLYPQSAQLRIMISSWKRVK